MLSMPARYRIRVQGLLGPQWADWFSGCTLSWQEPDQTVLIGLVDDLADQDGLVRLLPTQAESAEPGRPLRPQAALHANAVAGGHAQHNAAPLLLSI